MKIRNSVFLVSLLLTHSIYAEEAIKQETKAEIIKKVEAKKEEAKKEEAKKEEVKKEEIKNEEVKKEGPKIVEIKKPIIPAQPKECFYSAHALALVENNKFDEEVKKIQEAFERCQETLAKLKEQEVRAAECSALNKHVKEKRGTLLKLTAESSKLNKKEEFEKAVASIKVTKEELASYITKYRESCAVAKKVEVKEEPKKEEPKKEEPKV